MTTKTNGTDKVLEKVRDLVKLATGGANEEESRSAAIQVTKLMKEHELVLVPRTELERVNKAVEGARALAKQTEDEKNQNMMLAAIGGVALAKFLKL